MREDRLSGVSHPEAYDLRLWVGCGKCPSPFGDFWKKIPRLYVGNTGIPVYHADAPLVCDATHEAISRAWGRNPQTLNELRGWRFMDYFPGFEPIRVKAKLHWYRSALSGLVVLSEA
jgi:hypothetical protein